jgi:hypothetical protein
VTAGAGVTCPEREGAGSLRRASLGKRPKRASLPSCAGDLQRLQEQRQVRVLCGFSGQQQRAASSERAPARRPLQAGVVLASPLGFCLCRADVGEDAAPCRAPALREAASSRCVRSPLRWKHQPLRILPPGTLHDVSRWPHVLAQADAKTLQHDSGNQLELALLRAESSAGEIAPVAAALARDQLQRGPGIRGRSSCCSSSSSSSSSCSSPLMGSGPL